MDTDFPRRGNRRDRTDRRASERRCIERRLSFNPVAPERRAGIERRGWTERREVGERRLVTERRVSRGGR